MEEVRSREKSTLSTTRRINLEHIPSVNNTEILADVLGNSEAIFRVNNSGLRKKKRIDPGSLTNRSEANRSISPGSFFNTTQSSVQRDHNTTAESVDNLPLNNTLIKLNRTLEEPAAKKGASQYIWDYEAEYHFKTHKEEARARMFKEIKSSSWNEAGLGPFIQTSHKEKAQKSQRNHLLERYRKGDTLTIKEYSEVANTSKLLNSHADENFIQEVVDHLDPDIVGAVIF